MLSAIVQYAPYDLAAGWDSARDDFRDSVLTLLERYAQLRYGIAAGPDDAG